MENLLKNQMTVNISSLTKNKETSISYAPFVMIDNDLYIYISETANHYENLLTNKDCSVMIIEDESTCKNIFARTRVSFDCEASVVKENVEPIFEKFDEKFNSEMMKILKGMDFDIFKLKIKKGRLVKGFGQAYDITLENNEFVKHHIVLDGHNNR